MSPRGAGLPRRVWLWAGGAAAVLAAALGWWLVGPGKAPPTAVSPTQGSPVPARQAQAPSLSETAVAAGAATPPMPPGPPLSPMGEAQRREQRAQLQERLQRARDALTQYTQAARYPHDSRPIEEHADQVRPFDPIAEEHPLRMPGGGSVAAGVRLRTTQERVFLAGREASKVTVSLVDAEGRALPLRIGRAMLSEVTPPGRTASTAPFAMPMNDAGQMGDLLPNDGIFTATIQPANQGFASYAGLVRLELALEYAGQPGRLHFDVIYSPEQAATWAGSVRDAVEEGSLVFHLPVQVLQPGRYVASGRIDDAQGRPFALAQFNQELKAGAGQITLRVFGKLMHDRQPPQPLVLRDVEAFLLKPDTHPDRVMLPRLPGVVHRSAAHPLAAFSTEEWQSDERTRYLTELGKDVAELEGAIQKLQGSGP